MKKVSRWLRFASLVRVSTERQEAKGESLRTQRAQNEADVASLAGTIAATYGGQEHASPGFEHKEVDRLLTDAERGLFNAVIVADASRWSRDNAKSKAGLEVFRKAGVKFFIGTTEHDLFDPTVRLILGMAAEIGEFQALEQARKSLLNRIARARRGIPASHHIPFGRTFDRKTGKWDIDPEKRARLERAAARYLAGEHLPEVAGAEGFSVAGLHRAFASAGPEYAQTFKSPRLKIAETVPTKIPELLPAEVRAALRERAEAGKTYRHGAPKFKYLLGRCVFCSACGYAMSGQRTHGRLYYRHMSSKKLRLFGMRPCLLATMSVNAAVLDETVLNELFDLFGNPEAVRRAVAAAVPDAGATDAARLRFDALAADLERVAAGRGRLLKLVVKGTVSETDAERELTALKEKETAFLAERDRLHVSLINLPDPSEVEAAADRLSRTVRRFLTPRGKVATEDARGVKRIDVKMWAVVSTINGDRAGISWEDARALVQKVFAGRTADGRRMGVFVEGNRGSCRWPRWDYRLHGRLIDSLQGSAPDTDAEAEPLGGPLQEALLAEGELNSAIPVS
jgi:DNA invertase Pin-like site-specific DNA recombinase